MKFLGLIFTLFLSVTASAECEYSFSQICLEQDPTFRDRQLRNLNIVAFDEIANSNNIEDLICKNFDKQGGELVYDFLWNRSCWDWKYRRAYKRMGIQTCEDFTKAGAPENFILNCRHHLDRELVNRYYPSLHFKTRNMMKKVKENYLTVLEGESYYALVSRKFKQIIDMTHLEMNLSVFKAEFLKARDVCAKVNDYNFCSVYQSSDKSFLSLGAHAFYEEADLELFIAKMLAKYIAEDIKVYESLNIQRVYLDKVADYTHQWRIENLLARSISNDEINLDTIEQLLLKKYMQVLVKRSFFADNRSLDLLCPDNSSTDKDRGHYYFDYFTKLHPKDAMELMLCE